MGDSLDGLAPAVPVHYVQVGDYWISRHEVTKALWDEVYNWAIQNGYSFQYGGQGKAANHPVHSVTWYDAVKWCNARSEKEGLLPAYYTDPTLGLAAVYRTGFADVQNDWVRWTGGYRLPTEAEWEKAARGGVAGQRFWFGDTITHLQANYYSDPSYAYDVSSTRGYHPSYRANPFPFSSPVGSFAANGYGLYDMAGNMWEWCWDWYGSGYYSSSPAADPRGPASGSYRIQRGGSWSDFANFCRSAYRKNTYTPDSRDYNLGFRAVLPPSQP
jgi:formylglycine-generating enzyme required for sulfatase activity